MRNVRRLRRLKKISLATGSTREYFYQDTNSSHAYVADKNKHLRKTLDKKSGAAVICSFEYELDKAGNRLSVTDKDAKYTKYGIDGLYQLTNETKWSAKTQGTRTWQYGHKYDPNGNRTALHHDGVESDFTYGDNNEMTAGPSVSPTYDNFGNTTAYGGATLTYDFERHMTNYSGATHSDTDDHQYDGNGRRMRSKLHGAANWINFIHDQLTEQIIAEYTLISGTFAVTSVNTQGIGLVSTNRASTKRYFHFDGLGSTAALTDSSEVVQDTYFYSAYGTLESSTGSSVNPYRFVGQWGYYDDTTHGSLSGFILLGIRYYKPDWGRFMVWDALASNQRYVLCENQPVGRLDPSGRGWLSDVYSKYILGIFDWDWGGPWGWGYGHWCGYERQGRNGDPVDCLDECCRDHDYCLADWWRFIGPWGTYCNARLCACAMSAAALCCKNSPFPDSCKEAALYVQFLACTGSAILHP